MNRKKPRSKEDIAVQLQNAQLTIVEQALVAFIESVLGRVPSEPEILRESFHMAFPPESLGIIEKEGKRFSQYWCWGKEHVVALGFLDSFNPLDLYTVRLNKEEWPIAVRLAIEQHGKPIPGEEWKEGK